MRDVWDLVRDIEAGDLSTLRDELASGFAPNTACEYTGMTVLLGACEANNVEAVQILLAAGADPNQQHHDGYDPYNSTRSRAVREVLWNNGFSLLIDATSEGRGTHSRRVLAPRPISNLWSRRLDGPTVLVEWSRSTFPPTFGEVLVRIDGREVRPAAGDHTTLPATPGPREVTVELVDFVGEFRIRLWDEATISTNTGDRSFWVPAWTDG